MEIEQIKKSYQRKQKLYHTKQDNIQKQIKKLDEKKKHLEEKNKNMTYPHFKENYLKPIAEELLKHLPNRYYEILGCFGLNCEASIHFYKKDITKENMFEGDNCISLTFRPRDDDLVLVNHLVNTHLYPQGSLGELNGDNYTTLPMKKNIKELLKFMKEQNKERK